MPNLRELELSASWKQFAFCKGMDPNIFFVKRGQKATYDAAVWVCAQCPVRAECLDYALAHKEKFGIFGGKSDRGRRKWRLQVRQTQSEFLEDINEAITTLFNDEPTQRLAS